MIVDLSVPHYLRYIKLNLNGSLCAVTCKDGKKIYIVDTKTGEILHCFYRGFFKCKISNIDFDEPTNDYILVTSNRMTVHIFSLKKQHMDVNVSFCKFHMSDLTNSKALKNH
jgi:hypothetical protein